LSGRISAFSKILIAGVFGSRGLVTPDPLRVILEGVKIEAQQWLKID